MTFDINNLSEEDKKIIDDGIMKGLADVEAGRFQEFNEDFIIELKSKLRIKLANKEKTNN